MQAAGEGGLLQQLTKRLLESATEAAALAVVRVRRHLGARHPPIVRLWENAWAEFVPFLGLDVEIREVICSTNAIESVNDRIRRAVRPAGTRTSRPS